LLRSTDRLDPRHREAMARLCRLDAVFDLPQAGRMLGVEPLRAEGPVGRLVESNLLMVVGTGPDGSARFQFPPLLRLAVLANARRVAGLGRPAHYLSPGNLVLPG
jgi:hypothetical protein